MSDAPRDRDTCPRAVAIVGWLSVAVIALAVLLALHAICGFAMGSFDWIGPW